GATVACSVCCITYSCSLRCAASSSACCSGLRLCANCCSATGAGSACCANGTPPAADSVCCHCTPTSTASITLAATAPEASQRQRGDTITAAGTLCGKSSMGSPSSAWRMPCDKSTVATGSPRITAPNNW